MIKQFIICRCDMGMRKGKIAAQICHASHLWFMRRFNLPATKAEYFERRDAELAGLYPTPEPAEIAAKISPEELDWLGRPSPLIILRAETKEQFLQIADQLAEAGIEHHIWTEDDLDDEPTALGTPPIDEAKMKPITGSLKLLQ